jgi:metal-responsive CopG/Arc/MetJ family transcriptional regulator
MTKAKIAITIDKKIVGRLDHLVHQKAFSNRSQAIEQALQEKIDRIDKTRLAREVSRLNQTEEKALSEEGIDKDISEWPKY